jgi:hypothetical protein
MVNIPEIVSVARLVRRSHLAGAALGREHQMLFTRAVNNKHAAILCFDWSGIEVATASYLRQAYVPVFTFAGASPVITSGLNQSIQDDLEFALQAEGRPILVISPKDKRGAPEFIGPLDEAYVQALLALERRGEATATSLFEEYKNRSESSIGKTAWINRLNRLFEMGLVSRTKPGKEYRYARIQLS